MKDSYNNKKVDNMSELEFIKMLVSKNYSIKEIVNQCNKIYKNNRTINSIKSKMYIENIRGNMNKKITKKEIVKRINDDRKIESLKSDIQILRKKYESVIKNINIQDKLINMNKQYLNSLTPLKLPNIIKNKNKELSKETAMLLLSDCHIGEVVNFEETHGLCEYNVDIFRNRIDHLCNTIINIVEKKLMGYDIKKLVIAQLGDMVSGNIHEELVETSQGNILDWVYGGAKYLAKFIYQLTSVFEEIEVVCIPGNHGRTKKKPYYKNKYVNWDTILYHTQSAYFSNNKKRVNFIIPKSPFYMYNVENHKFLFMHGDDIQSWMNIPFYGILRASSELSKVLYDQYGKFDYLALGHFHKIGILDDMGGEILINGSVIGGNEFSLGKLKTMSLPKQMFFGVHKEKGISWRFHLDLINSKKIKYDDEFFPTVSLKDDLDSI